MKRQAILFILVLGAVCGSGFAGVWIGRQKLAMPALFTLRLQGTVTAVTLPAQSRCAGRVRLVAVRAGDRVKAGQLVAWLESPELRESAQSADEAARDAQDRLAAHLAGRPPREADDYSRARDKAAAAQSALEEAQRLSQELPSLAQLEAAARRAQAVADATLAQAEARLAEAHLDAAPAGNSEEGALASGTSSAVERALAAVERLRREKESADRQVASLRRRRMEAEAAAARIPLLSASAMDAAAAAEEARGALESTALGKNDAASLRRAVRDAETAAAQARDRLKDLLVVAPASGMIDQVHVGNGAAVQRGDRIATIRIPDAYQVEIPVTARVARRIALGQRVAVNAVSQPETEFPGTVKALTPVTAGEAGEQMVRIAIQDPQRLIHPGEAVEIRFP